MSDVETAFLGYYDTYRDKIYTYLLYRVGFRREVAEDLAQDVFVKAFDHFENFDESKGGFQAWIYRIAHNHLVNYYRDTKKVESIENAFNLSDLTDIVGEVSDRLEAERILATLALLASDEREVLFLHYRQDLGNKELATVLNKPEGAVRTALSRAKARLREIYLKIYPTHA